MKIKYSIFLLVFSVFASFSCKPKMTCSAYNSYFILDKEVIEKMYSPFGSDSLPTEKSTEKDNHNIAQKVTEKVYKKKHYYIPMKLVPPPKSEVADSTATDSTAAPAESLEDITPTNNTDTEEKPDKVTEKDINLEDDNLWKDEDETEEEPKEDTEEPKTP